MAGSWTAFAVLRVLQIRKPAGKCCCSLNELTCHPLWHAQHPKSLQSPFSSFDSQTAHCSNPNPAIKPQNCHSFLYPWQSVALNFKQKASSQPPFPTICALRINLCNEVIGLIWTMTDFPMARFLNSAENAWRCCPGKELFKQGSTTACSEPPLWISTAIFARAFIYLCQTDLVFHKPVISSMHNCWHREHICSAQKQICARKHALQMQSIPVLQTFPYENPFCGVIALLIFKECQTINGKMLPSATSKPGNSQPV